VKRVLTALKPSGGTAIYDAIIESLPLIDNRSRTRAALLVISDGADTASNATLRDLRRALLRSDTFVYAIAIDSPERQVINTRVNAQTLREITAENGGRTEVVRSSSDLAEATARIAEELNSQYVLGYTSSHGADGQFHSIRVRAAKLDQTPADQNAPKVQTPQSPVYRVRARNGYVATPLTRRRGR
jgi:VWFA-related protein